MVAPNRKKSAGRGYDPVKDADDLVKTLSEDCWDEVQEWCKDNENEVDRE